MPKKEGVKHYQKKSENCWQKSRDRKNPGGPQKRSENNERLGGESTKKRSSHAGATRKGTKQKKERARNELHQQR